MKGIKLLVFVLSCGFIVNAQEVEINANNYCYFYNENAHYPNSDIKTFYLTEIMLIDIVRDEMSKLGFKWVNTFRIIKIDTSYVTSICYSDKSNCGFLIDDTFDMIPQQESRNIISLYKKDSGFDYGEKIVHTDGSYEFVKIKEIPKNLHILNLDNYWYQESTNPEKNKKLVSKEFIVELLKNDVRFFLKDFKP
jgi:hypothetical protein